MYRNTALAILGVLATGPLAGCSSEAEADPNSLTMKIGTEISGPNCRPIADYSVGIDHALRLVNYTVTMTGPGERDTTKIPSGVILMPSSGLKKGRAISLHNHQAACGEMTVVWTDFKCEGEDRQPMACPPIVLTGGSDFKSVEVVAPVAQ